MLTATSTGPTTIAPQMSYDTLSIAHAEGEQVAEGERHSDHERSPPGIAAGAG